MRSALAVQRDTFDSGVVTFLSERQSVALITETAAPVSTRASAATPSTYTSIILVGEGRGLGLFVGDAVLASGTAAISFPVPA